MITILCLCIKRRDITVAAAGVTQISFKNYVQFTKCITKIDGTTTDDAEY